MSLKIILKVAEASIRMRHQPIDSFRKSLPGLLLGPVHHSGHDVHIRDCSQTHGIHAVTGPSAASGCGRAPG